MARKYLSWFLLTITLSLFIESLVFSKGIKVKEVIDGDTIVLESGEHFRYVGIDTPEKDQPFYLEAKELNQKLVESKEIRIEFDLQRKDKYGRTLAYVYVGETFVNAELVRNGLANLYTVPPNVKHTEYFLKLQSEAKEKKLGIWSEAKKPEKNYLARRGSKRFHRPSCTVILSAPQKDLIIFKTKDQALKQGFSPCKICQP
ncbi:MAG: Nuclease (SNase protein) [candidate division Zixibacteria bacterium RBG-1]|nr:MAG: Nuclease (SNase protein) [candidate division Zixibacteria bacterium RBG-1]